MSKIQNFPKPLIIFLVDNMNLKIYDNFLIKEDFDILEDINLPSIKPNELRIFNFSEILSEKIVERFYENYQKKALDILKELCPEKVNLYDYTEFHLILTGKNYKFPIHDDTPNKLLSGVIYINPEKNSGTSFYDTKEGLNKNEIQWKKNRAVFFSRIERETWHSYEGDGINTRIALVFNLMTNDIKSVCKIENKNFLYSFIRFKLNPYIYRYFNRTI